MKRLIIILIGLFSIYALSGQNSGNKLKVGAALAYGSKIQTIGLNLMGSYNFTDAFRVAPNFTFFIPKTDDFIGWTQKTHLWTFNLDLHYIIPVETDPFSIYGLAGINVAGQKYKGKAKDPTNVSPVYNFTTKDTDFGLNLGVGGEYPFSDKISGQLEIKYVISDFGQLVVKAGVAVGL